jgi:hypothetical protein
MNTWEIAVLKSIEHKGGSASNRQIYVDIESGKFITMHPDHLRATEYGGRPAYQHQVRSHLTNLVEAGDLVRPSRGNYKLTTQGRMRLSAIAA